MARQTAGRKQNRATIVEGNTKPVLRSAMMATRAQARRTLAEATQPAAALPSPKPAARGRSVAGRPATRATGRPATKPAATKHPEAQRRGGRSAPAPERIIRIRELDPYAKCGPDTSVTELYRVDEAVNGAKHVHLVFFDRHGWYCMHGRACPAVNDVRRMERAHSVRTH